MFLTEYCRFARGAGISFANNFLMNVIDLILLFLFVAAEPSTILCISCVL